MKIDFNNPEVFNPYSSVVFAYKKLMKGYLIGTSVIMIIGILISLSIPFWSTDLQAGVFMEFKKAGEIRSAGSGIPDEMKWSITPLITEGLEQLEVSAQRLMQKLYDNAFAKALLFIFFLAIVIPTAIQMFSKGEFNFFEIVFKVLWLVIIASIYAGITSTSGVFHSIVYFPLKTLLKDMPAFIMDSSDLISGFYGGVFKLFDTTDSIPWTSGLKLIVVAIVSLIGVVAYSTSITLIILTSFIGFYLMYAVSPIFIILLGHPKTRGYTMGVFNIVLTSVITINLLAVYVTLMRGFALAVSTNSGLVGMIVVCIFTYASSLLVFTIPAMASTIAGGTFGNAESVSSKLSGDAKKGISNMSSKGGRIGKLGKLLSKFI